MKSIFHLLLLLVSLSSFASLKIEATEYELLLRNNLHRAKAGDFIVTAQNKTYTLLLVRDKTDKTLTFEEITTSSGKVPKNFTSWKTWIESGAPGHTSWVMYNINLATGDVLNSFSFTKNEWYSIPQSQNFLSTMLNLHLKYIPENERKRVGPRPHSGTPDWRPYWQPRLVVEGQTLTGVGFSAWRTRWPKDGSELANKSIEVYIPQENEKYPSYFPYWLQISGMIGKAKIRIVDSGSHLLSPQPKLP